MYSPEALIFAGVVGGLTVVGAILVGTDIVLRRYFQRKAKFLNDVNDSNRKGH